MAEEREIGERQQTVAVGCLTAVVGFFSGAMIALLIGKWVGAARGCTPVEGLPACDWQYYFFGGGVIGAITLPLLTIRALRRSRRSAGKPERG